MRLHLSSFRVGDRPEELTSLLGGGKTALISNALDYVSSDDRRASVVDQLSTLRSLGLDAAELTNHLESEAIEAVIGWWEEHAIPFVALRDGEAIVVRDGDSRVVSRADDADVVIQTSRGSTTA